MGMTFSRIFQSRMCNTSLNHAFITEYSEIEKDHGRIETRRCIASDVLTRWSQPGYWSGVRSVVMVEATREIGDTITVERRYYVSS